MKLNRMLPTQNLSLLGVSFPIFQKLNKQQQSSLVHCAADNCCNDAVDEDDDESSSGEGKARDLATFPQNNPAAACIGQRLMSTSLVSPGRTLRILARPRLPETRRLTWPRPRVCGA